MVKVVVAQPIDPSGIALLAAASHAVVQLDRHDEAALAEAVADADGLLVRDARVTRVVLASGRRLRVVSRHGAGLDRIDMAAATEMGIAVTNTPEANSVSVAEHVLAMMLALAKNFFVTDPANREGNFAIRHQRYGFELEGRSLGILGLGNIGRRLARKALFGLGMRVVGYDPYVDRTVLPVEMEWAEDWRVVLGSCDVVSLHLPLTAETRGMIGIEALRLMKPTALLINCARGEIVREPDLIQALREGVIAGAGIDVYDPDPPPSEHPLFAFDNVIVTPHTAAHTHEAMRNMAVQAAQGIVEVLAGKAPTWPANRPVAK
jgi:D-3-phosphoglycerate dehydrogenase